MKGKFKYWISLRRITNQMPRAGLLIAFFGLFIIAAAWMSVLSRSSSEFSSEIERINRENGSLARAFEEHVRSIVNTSDRALLFLEMEYEKHGAITESMRDFIERSKKDPVFNQIALADTQGDLLLSAIPLRQPVNISKNETFLTHLQNPDAGLYIAKPIITQASGTWSFFLARRLNKPDGSFGGIVTVGLNPKYFSDYFSILELGPDKAIILVGRDGIVRARRFQDQSRVGQDISTSPLFEEIRHKASGHYEVVGVIDSLKRFASYRAMQDYPLIVLVSDLKAAALTSVDRRKRAYYLNALLFTLFVSVFCILLIRADLRRRSQNIRLADELEERKKAENALQKSYSSLQAVVDSVDAGIYVADMETDEILLINRYIRQIFGDIEGRKCRETIQKGQTGPCSLCTNDKLLGSDGRLLDTFVWEFQNTVNGRLYECRDKAIRWIDGRVVRLEIATDITEQKKMEDELLRTRKLESVGLLASGIAHDFNNLLQVIMGNISLAKVLLAEDSKENINVCLEHAEEASTAAKELSFRLLTFSKGGEPVKRVTSVDSVLRRSATLSLSGSSISCDLRVPADLYAVDIDEGQMMQVFNNIIINAKEAMPPGGTVTVSAANVTITDIDAIPLKQGNYVRISIHDSGAGIPAEVLPVIFDPYFTTKVIGPQRGIGLGLSISLTIVKKHNGHISVHSEEGAGTTFHIYIPAAFSAITGVSFS